MNTGNSIGRRTMKKELNEIKKILQDRKIKHNNFEVEYKIGFNKALELSLMLIDDALVGETEAKG